MSTGIRRGSVETLTDKDVQRERVTEPGEDARPPSGSAAGGMTEAELLSDFPDLAREDIRASLAFAAARERRVSSVA